MNAAQRGENFNESKEVQDAINGAGGGGSKGEVKKEPRKIEQDDG